MSSTGTIHKTRAAISVHGEAQRQAEQDMGAASTAESATHRGIGTVSTIHPDKPRLVLAHDDDGSVLANGNWIQLNHSAQEIAERWGTVRVGFRIRASWTGPAGVATEATIIGVENEDVRESHVPNEASVGLWAIFHGHFA